MIELLIVIAIVVILFVVLLLSLRTQVSRGRDAERKTDLERIKVAFEDYYNDNNCYPGEGVLEHCESADLQPYLQSIPCDPLDGQPYLYVPLSSDNCEGYRVYTGLEATGDPSIEEVGCDQEDGCGYGADYNYGISSGVAVYDEDATPFPSPSPSSAPASSNPSPSVSPSASPLYEYACDNDGVCNRYNHGEAPDSCPVTFLSSDCDNGCGDPVVRCEN
jgi:type II secretory pathway pseudopilin PulG